MVRYAPKHVRDFGGVINWQNGENCKLRLLISTVLLDAWKCGPQEGLTKGWRH